VLDEQNKGEGTPSGSGQAPDNDTTPNANGSGQQPGGGSGQAPFITFPDERSFMGRVGREAKKQLEVRAKELGFDNVQAMEETIKAAKAAAEAQKTELQKAQERAQAAEAKGAQMQEAVNQRLIRAEVTVKGAALGIVDSEAAALLMDRSAVRVDEHGNVEGIEEALKALVAAKPYLVGGKPAPGPVPKAGDNQNDGKGQKGFDMNALIRRAAGRA